jgi:3-hydroxyacyl-CoA dehydrogenase
VSADAAAKVACIGCGNVGRAWSLVFARGGCEVALYDSADGAVERALELVAAGAADLKQAGLIDDAAALLARIHPAASLAEAVADVDHVQESVREDVAIKRTVFAALWKHVPAAATLASSTSALPASTFTGEVQGRERCLVAHPVNPPSLIPLVELCPAPWTDPQALQRVRELMLRVGQKPIVLKKEVPGFIINRLQYTLVGEAMHLVGEGYCDAEDIDAVLTEGLALRWAHLGPFAVAHLNATEGFRGFVGQLGDMMRTVGREARPDYDWDEELIGKIHDELAHAMPVADIPEKQRERDRRIMSLLRWRNREAGTD